MFVAKLKALYRTTTDHLTKVIGAVGATLMYYLSFVDPESIGTAAQRYLGQHAYAKIGGALFALVVWRGWWTGKKAKDVKPA